MKHVLHQTLVFCLCVGYLLGVKNGYLALWKHEDPEPIYVFDLAVASLPPGDQVRLERGIRAESLDAMLILLEDYF